MEKAGVGRAGIGGVVQRVVVEPLRKLLRVGATPEQLAWSIALGMVVGVNPLIGSTTLVVLGLAAAFRLNLVASQIGNHAMYPVEILMFPVFVKVGSLVFASQKLPLQGKKLVEAVRHHPLETTRLLWTWEWHALVVWVGFAAVMLPVVAMGLRPVLRRMMVQSEFAVSSPS